MDLVTLYKKGPGLTSFEHSWPFQMACDVKIKK